MLESRNGEEGNRVGKADETRERILEAATAEFAAYGVAGARVDRIAKAAGCNKNLIYIYFENKENLFSTVLARHLARVYEELDFTPDDLPGYAGRIFDFAMAHADLMRLMAWSALERPPGEQAGRIASRDAKVAAMTRAEHSGPGALPPAFLITVIMTIATAWTAASPFGLTLAPDAAKDQAALRANVVAAVQRISGV
jgi:AcrR family transcriptional regulator